MCEFGALSFLLFFGLYPRIRVLIIIAISIVYAFLDELHQYFVPFRYFDIFDFFLDVVGVIGGFIFFLLVKFIRNRIKSKN
jgi:VanZ family protein